MSDFIVVADNVVQSVVDYATQTVVSGTRYREPVVSSSQGPQGPPGISAATSVSTLQDVDLSSLDDGSLLIYATANRMWKATTVLEKQALECGQY